MQGAASVLLSSTPRTQLRHHHPPEPLVYYYCTLHKTRVATLQLGCVGAQSTHLRDNQGHGGIDGGDFVMPKPHEEAAAEGYREQPRGASQPRAGRYGRAATASRPGTPPLPRTAFVCTFGEKLLCAWSIGSLCVYYAQSGGLGFNALEQSEEKQMVMLC